MTYKSIRSVLMLSIVFLLCAGTALAQNTGTIKGRLLDQKTQEPLISANVYIPSLNKGAATDVNGTFTITDVPYGTYEMRISYIGYTTKNISVTVDEPVVTINRTLSQDIAQLGDVVVTAFGVERQVNQLPYAAEKINTEEVTRSGSANVFDALAGRVSGMKVETASGMGGSTDIVLRGENSLTGNNQALIVVDGVPYANQRFNTADQEAGFAGYDFGSTGFDINPQDIASMTVLKGPAAAALYGSRGANGAIIIETKKGQPGQDAVNVTYNGSVGASMVDESTFPTYQMEYGQGYVGGLYYQANPFTEAAGDSIYTTRYDADASFGPAFDENKMVYTWQSFDPNNPNYGQPMPYTAPENQPIEFFETGTNIQNSININGGIGGGGYYSLGYTQSNTRGVLPNSELDKYKLSFSGGYEVSDKLTVDASIDYAKTDDIGRPARGYSTIMSEMRQWWGTNVDVLDQKAAYFRAKQNAAWNLTGDREGPFYWNNPYFERYENFASQSRDRYTGYAKADYEVADWLSLSGQVSLDSFNNLIEERNAVGSVGVSEYERRTTNYAEYNYKMIASYNKQLTEKFSIDGLAGFNIRRQNIQGISASTNGGLVVPGLYSLNNSVNSILYPDETEENLGVNSLMASMNLNYDNYLNVALTGRRDQSSTLPEGNNVYYYPSASVGFTFSEFIDSDALSFGKIRASVAQVGNTAPVYSLTDTYTRGANFGSAGLYSLPSTKNNPTLKPEITKSWEVGLQLGFINDALFLDATYYDENTINQIFPVNISGASGYTTKFVNAGNVENRGISIGATARPVTTGDFSWSVNAKWSKNMSKIKELAPGIDYFEQARTQGVSIGSKVGDEYGVIRGTDFVYHENGGRIVDPETGLYEISSSSEEVIGTKNPDWRGSLSNNFNYKNWSLNVLVDVRWGGDIFSLDQWYGQGTGLYPITAGTNDLGNPKRDPVTDGEDSGGVILPGVNPDGTPNETRAQSSNYAGAYGWVNSPNARYVYDGTFVKLRELGITYNFSPEMLSSLKALSGASVSLTGRNLWIIHKNVPHADPEATLGAGNLGGYQGGNMPAIRNVTLNLQLNF